MNFIDKLFSNYPIQLDDGGIKIKKERLVMTLKGRRDYGESLERRSQKCEGEGNAAR
jgi:hypothetical protein